MERRNKIHKELPHLELHCGATFGESVGDALRAAMGENACDTFSPLASNLTMNAHAPVLKWLVSLGVSAGEADWEALYRQELPRIYNFFRYRTGDSALAEDLSSITFEKAWRARHQHRRDLAAFSTWLFAIARNVAIDHFRRRRVELPIEELDEAPAPDDLEVPAAAP